MMLKDITDTPSRLNSPFYKGLSDLATDPEEWLWLCLFRNGDTYLFCSLAEAFLNHHGCHSGITAITSGSKDIPRLFAPSIRNVVSHPNISWSTLWGLERWDILKPGYPIVPHPSLCGDGRLTTFESHPSKAITFLDLTKYTLRLPWSVKPARPIIKPEWKDEADEIFTRSGLRRGVSVVLFPYVQSMSGPTSNKYWINLAEKLIDLGFDVCTSTSAEEAPIDGTRSVFIPFRNLISFCEIAGWAVVLRSGIADILSTAECRRTVIHTHQFFIDFYGLERMGLTSDATEIIYEMKLEPSDEELSDFSELIIASK